MSAGSGLASLLTFPVSKRDEQSEIIVDSFAGGGGASTGILMALGRHPDVAINHDPEAVAMHTANHSTTRHHCQNVWQVNPSDVAAAGPIGLAWFSPDCKHFSKAKGGKPVEKRTRDLAWVVVGYAKLPHHLRPRVIILENVEEFVTWGPLGLDGRPCPERKGDEFRRWAAALRRLGYRLDWRELRACDYGAPTIRKRFFLVARCDGAPIVWPDPSHGAPDSPEVLAGQLLPWRTAADIIDWSLPCPSIFLTPEEARAMRVKRPLEEATQRRIYNGLWRYVINHHKPFIVPVTHGGDGRCYDSAEPLRTITTAHGGEFAVVAPYLHTYYGAKRADEVRGTALDGQIGTQTTENRHALVMPWMAQHNLGATGHEVGEPLSTVTGTGSQQMLTAACVTQFHGSNQGNGGDPRAPLGAVLAQGCHHAEVRAFLVKYYGQGGQDQDCRDPLHTVPTKARFGLVTVGGEDWAIVDIGMRMLSPRELFRAQGFPEDYQIAITCGARTLSKAAQIRMCGNSVCPPIAAALVAANVPELAAVRPERARA